MAQDYTPDPRFEPQDLLPLAGPFDAEAVREHIQRACFDPGSFTHRESRKAEYGGGRDYEALHVWQSRAIMLALKLTEAGGADAGPAEPEPLSRP